jgi:hypothetical protein
VCVGVVWHSLPRPSFVLVYYYASPSLPRKMFWALRHPVNDFIDAIIIKNVYELIFTLFFFVCVYSIMMMMMIFLFRNVYLVFIDLLLNCFAPTSHWLLPLFASPVYTHHKRITGIFVPQNNLLIKKKDAVNFNWWIIVILWLFYSALISAAHTSCPVI